MNALRPDVMSNTEGWIFRLVQLLLNDARVPLLAIIAIHHVLIHLFKRSKDKERVHYGIIFMILLIVWWLT